MGRYIVPVLFLIAFGACEDQLIPVGEESVSNNVVSVKTDSSRYIFNSYVTRVGFTIWNNSDSTARFSHCADRYAYYLERNEHGQWIEKGGWGIWCEAIYSTGIRALLPDSVYHDVAQVTERGTYRLVFPYSLRCGTSLNDSLVSNEFQVQ